MNRPWRQDCENPNRILDSAGQPVCLLAATPDRDQNAQFILATIPDLDALEKSQAELLSHAQQILNQRPMEGGPWLNMLAKAVTRAGKVYETSLERKSRST